MCCADVFMVDPLTGVIRTKVDLDGLVGVYQLIVQGVDHGLPQLSSTAIVTVTVLPSNILPPIWINPDRDDLRTYIREVRIYCIVQGVPEKTDHFQSL